MMKFMYDEFERVIRDCLAQRQALETHIVSKDGATPRSQHNLVQGVDNVYRQRVEMLRARFRRVTSILIAPHARGSRKMSFYRRYIPPVFCYSELYGKVAAIMPENVSFVILHGGDQVGSDFELVKAFDLTLAHAQPNQLDLTLEFIVLITLPYRCEASGLQSPHPLSDEDEREEEEEEEEEEQRRKTPKQRDGTDIPTNSHSRERTYWTIDEVRLYQFATTVYPWGKWSDMARIIGSRNRHQVRRFALSQRGQRLRALATPLAEDDPLRWTGRRSVKAAVTSVQAAATTISALLPPTTLTPPISPYNNSAHNTHRDVRVDNEMNAHAHFNATSDDDAS